MLKSSTTVNSFSIHLFLFPLTVVFSILLCSVTVYSLDIINLCLSLHTEFYLLFYPLNKKLELFLMIDASF